MTHYKKTYESSGWDDEPIGAPCHDDDSQWTRRRSAPVGAPYHDDDRRHDWDDEPIGAPFHDD